MTMFKHNKKKGWAPRAATALVELQIRVQQLQNDLDAAKRREEIMRKELDLSHQSTLLSSNMLGKNSQPGERNAMSKITDRVARAIRAAKKVCGSGVRLARKYGIST